MLKKRIVATLVVRGGIVVQSLAFERYLPVGKPDIAMEFLDDWGIDEIILLDISATKNERAPDYTMVRDAATRCRVPLTVGGGVSNTEQISNLMHCGADKVALNQAALNKPALLKEASNLFGSQCVVASIDVLRIDCRYCIYDYFQRKVLPIQVTEFARKLQDLGAGEILVNSVDRDGAKCGFDLHLVNEVCGSVAIPVICCGGAGSPQHFIDVLKNTKVSAVAAGNFFHFTEHSVTTTKAQISKVVSIRHESYAQYENNPFDDSGRLLKKTDSEFEELLYQRIEKEVL